MPQTPATHQTPVPPRTVGAAHPHRPAATGRATAALPQPAGPRPSGGVPEDAPGNVLPLLLSRPADVTEIDAAEALTGYLNAWASEFLRSLRRHGESVGSAETAGTAAEAVRRLRQASRRLGGTLRTYRPLLDAVWADRLCGELRWLSATLSREYEHAARLERLHAALHRLSGEGEGEGEGGGGGEALAGAAGAGAGTGAGSAAGSASREGAAGSRSGAGTGRHRTGGQSSAGTGSTLHVGTARAGALLERQLTLARNRAHSAALQALVSNRFHAVADAVAVLASEVPLAPGTARTTADAALVPPADQARARLVHAVSELPLPLPEAPYPVDHGPRPVTARTSRLRQDAAWHEVRLLLRLHRYAEEVLLTGVNRAEETRTGTRGTADAGEPDDAVEQPDPAAVQEPDRAAVQARLVSASAALEEHREAVEAAEAAAAAARTPRIAPATAYALGVLHADQRQAAEAARLAFGALWRRPVRPLL
ncbi:CHAD domain-containing protein [Streptomyces ovatisporus]|uniref:CHAD domain-containing protein n=1 Tax=Streptomyces ovatisporus TaxID=1128682 RepID=A0ABV9A6S4_9ACTN